VAFDLRQRWRLNKMRGLRPLLFEERNLE
jgi:hypothetical protein